jgi:hypothetical protein
MQLTAAYACGTWLRKQGRCLKVVQKLPRLLLTTLVTNNVGTNIAHPSLTATSFNDQNRSTTFGLLID